MEKEFSFGEMFKYCCRKWLIILVAAVIGCGAFSVYSYVFKNRTDIVSYSGNATIASINTLYPEINSAIDKELYGNIIIEYNQNLDRALNIMSTSGLKNTVYTMVKDLYTPIKAEQTSGVEREFYNSLRVVKTAISIDVSFISRDKTDAEIELVKKIVDVYLIEAISAVQIDNPVFKPEKAIVKSALVESSEIITNDGKILGGDAAGGKASDILIGLVGGLVAGVFITIVVYFVDRRVKSYEDISYISGEKLLGVVYGGENSAICPKIDAVIDEKKAKTVLITSDESLSYSLGNEYCKYCASAGYKTLMVDFSGKYGGKAGDFSRLLTGGKIPMTEDGYFAAYTCIGEWASLLSSKEQFTEIKKGFDRVVIVYDYIHDGALAVIGQVCDGAVLAVQQSTSCRRVIYDLADELNGIDKMVGAVIFNPNKSYVGKIN